MISHVDYDGFAESVNAINCNRLLDSNDINISSGIFTDTLSNLCDTFIPNKKVMIRPGDCIWMNGYLRKQMRKEIGCTIK